MLLAGLERGLAQVRAAGTSEGIALGAVAAGAGRHLLGPVLVGDSSSSTGSSLHGLLLRLAERRGREALEEDHHVLDEIDAEDRLVPRRRLGRRDLALADRLDDSAVRAVAGGGA